MICRKIHSSVVNSEISEKRIFRATYPLFLPKFPDDLVLAVEDVAENDWVITTWAVILHPFTG